MPVGIWRLVISTLPHETHKLLRSDPWFWIDEWICRRSLTTMAFCCDAFECARTVEIYSNKRWLVLDIPLRTKLWRTFMSFICKKMIGDVAGVDSSSRSGLWNRKLKVIMDKPWSSIKMVLWEFDTWFGTGGLFWILLYGLTVVNV